MSATTGKSAPLRPPITPANWGKRTLLSPWIWGPLLTIGFYASILYFPEDRELVMRYFCTQPIQFAETGLFFLGLAVLIRKALHLVQEHRALKLIMIDAESLNGIQSPEERARSLIAATMNVPAGMQGTKLVARIRAACEYVARRGQCSAVDDHLRYLADLALENLTSSYALVRTIIWTVPILGVLGTIMGISLALQGIEADNLDASHWAAAAGLGAACHPTVLALALSIVLVFGKLFVERRESSLLAAVEQFGIDKLAPCLNLEPFTGAAAPLATAEAKVSAQLLERTETLINWQTALWQQALEGLRGRWIETVQQQEAQFAAALRDGMTASLASHSQQLDAARDEFLNGFRAVGLELSRVTAGLQQMGEDHQDRFHSQVTEVWKTIEAQIAAARGESQEQMARSVALLETAVHAWRDELGGATAALTAQLHEFRRQTEVLHNLAGREGELVRLQTTLTHNLQSVRALEAFEESIHSLNAAVHLLTMRTKAHAA